VAVKTTYGTQKQRYGTGSPTSGGSLSTLAQAPAAPSQYRAMYGATAKPKTVNPVSDVLNSAQVARQPAMPPAPKVYDGGNSGDGFGGTDTGIPPGYNSTGTPKAPNTGDVGASLDVDPILAQIKAIGARSVKDAASGVAAGAKNALIGFGSVKLPQRLRDLFTNQVPAQDSVLGQLPDNPLLGALNDTGTAAAAEQNPYSTLAQLTQGHQRNVADIGNQTNLSNLFYSSTHANKLADEQSALQAQQDQAAQSLAGILGGYNQAYLDSIGNARDQYTSELPGAFDRQKAFGPPTTEPPTTPGAYQPPVDQAEGTGRNTGAPQTAPDYLSALMLAGKTRRAVIL
jgi:hypothetical protein